MRLEYLTAARLSDTQGSGSNMNDQNHDRKDLSWEFLVI